MAPAESETTGTPPVVIRASQDKDIEDMLAIYRRHIRRGADESIEEYDPLQPDDLRRRRKNMRNHHLPHLVATRDSVLVGYAYAVLFQKRPAYRYTAKHSTYVHHEHLREGIGRILLPALIDACAAAGFRQMVGYIDSANVPRLNSIRSSVFATSACSPRLDFNTAAGAIVLWCSAPWVLAI